MDMSTGAGRYNRRIAIQQRLEIRNTSGGNTETYVTVSGLSSVPAQFIYPLPSKKGDEALLQQQVQGQVFVTIKIRYRPTTNISSAMQVVYGTRKFNIRTIIVDDESYREITMQCEELQAKGSLHT